MVHPHAELKVVIKLKFELSVEKYKLQLFLGLSCIASVCIEISHQLGIATL